MRRGTRTFVAKELTAGIGREPVINAVAHTYKQMTMELPSIRTNKAFHDVWENVIRAAVKADEAWQVALVNE